MSATYEEAREALDDAEPRQEGGLGLAERGIAAQVGTGRAVLAVAEELEALVELLRAHLGPVQFVVPDDRAPLVDDPTRCAVCGMREREHPTSVCGTWTR